MNLTGVPVEVRMWRGVAPGNQLLREPVAR